ncbi:MAG: EscU/YscU/HrcU family type III secretion system export apparatus switch protein [Myxococcaceae bacterium]|nr:EscU/YscU/HrcU family type III secretion system export apparatus switch protein [Myxococcaceae bacterium]
MSEKTHQPTEQKLRQAREQGNIPKSRMLQAAAVTLGGLAATIAFSRQTSAHLVSWAHRLLSLQGGAPEAELIGALKVLGVCLIPTLAGALLGALVAGALMAGLQLNLSLVQPKLENLNPAQGLKKIFSPRQAVDLLKGLVVAAVVSFILWGAVEDAAQSTFRALSHDAITSFRVLFTHLSPALFKAAAVLVVLGLADYALARLRHTKDLMMTLEEVKQEHKNSDGDPHTKGKRKQLMKQLAMGGPARGVKKATAVVVNPTHIAVALRYDESECEAPYIVARGRELDALAIRREATALGIPIVRDVPLARSLVHYDVGEEVPEELYQAAATVLRVALEEKTAAAQALAIRPE